MFQEKHFILDNEELVNDQKTNVKTIEFVV